MPSFFNWTVRRIGFMKFHFSTLASHVRIGVSVNISILCTLGLQIFQFYTHSIKRPFLFRSGKALHISFFYVDINLPSYMDTQSFNDFLWVFFSLGNKNQSICHFNWHNTTHFITVLKILINTKLLTHPVASIWSMSTEREIHFRGRKLTPFSPFSFFSPLIWTCESKLCEYWETYKRVVSISYCICLLRPYDTYIGECEPYPHCCKKWN